MLVSCAVAFLQRLKPQFFRLFAARLKPRPFKAPLSLIPRTSGIRHQGRDRVICIFPSPSVAPPSRRLPGGRPRPPLRGRDALGTAGKMPALLVFRMAIIMRSRC